MNAVQQAAKMIADAIEKRGHYQGNTGEPPGKCCIVYNSGFSGLPSQVQNDLKKAIIEVAGIECTTHAEWDGKPYVPDWNDSVTTDEVLDVLRAIEVG